MDYTINVSMEFSILYNSLKSCIFSLNIAFILANSAYPDEMLLNVAFHLVLHCFPKYNVPVY